MNSIWEDYGINDSAQWRRLGCARDSVIAAVRHLDERSLECVFKEVEFMLFELPTRDAKYQREYVRRSLYPRLSAADARGE